MESNYENRIGEGRAGKSGELSSVSALRDVQHRLHLVFRVVAMRDPRASRYILKEPLHHEGLFLEFRKTPPPPPHEKSIFPPQGADKQFPRQVYGVYVCYIHSMRAQQVRERKFERL